MYKKIINIGDKFNDWTVIGLTDKRKNKHQMYEVQCKCGTKTLAAGYYLRAGKSKWCRSCSAVNRMPKGSDHRFYKHGCTMKGHPARDTYKVWVTMKQRCNDENSRDYINYGGRGITYCSVWEDFEAFLSDMGICPKGLSLERVDNNLNYNKENCRWVTRKVQNNNRRNNTRFMIDGVSICRTEIQDRMKWTRDQYRRRFESKGIEWIIEEYRKSAP